MYVICANSGEIARSDDMTEGKGYEKKQMPLSRKGTGTQDTVVPTDTPMTGHHLLLVSHRNIQLWLPSDERDVLYRKTKSESDGTVMGVSDEVCFLYLKIRTSF